MIPFLAHSKNELIQWRGIRRLFVCPSDCPSVNFCANRFFSQTNGRIATKLSQDGLQVSMHPGCAQGQGQRSHDMGNFVLAQKSLLLPGKWPDRDQTCTRWTPGQRASRVCWRSRSKVTWYAHFLGFLEWATPSLTVWFMPYPQYCGWMHNNFVMFSVYGSRNSLCWNLLDCEVLMFGKLLNGTKTNASDFGVERSKLKVTV